MSWAHGGYSAAPSYGGAAYVDGGYSAYPSAVSAGGYSQVYDAAPAAYAQDYAYSADPYGADPYGGYAAQSYQSYGGAYPAAAVDPYGYADQAPVYVSEAGGGYPQADPYGYPQEWQGESVGRRSSSSSRRRSPSAPGAGAGGHALSEANLRRFDPAFGNDRPAGDRASAASRRSSVGSQYMGVTTTGPYTRLQRAKSQYTDPGQCPKPTGRRLALIVAINPERSRAAQNSARHMENLLRRYNYTVEKVLFTGDPEQLEADIEAGITTLTQVTESGDSVVFHVVGYGVFQGQDLTPHLNHLASNLPAGSKLTIIMDCCYCPTKLAYGIDPSAPKPRSKRDNKRLARQLGQVAPVPPSVFMFQGDANNKDIARFDANDGQSCVFTTAFLLAFNKKATRGFWDEPAGYASLVQQIDAQVSIIAQKQPPNNKFSMVVQGTCSQPFDIDQPAWL